MAEFSYRGRQIIVPLAGLLRDPEEVVRHKAGFALKDLNPDARLILLYDGECDF